MWSHVIGSIRYSLCEKWEKVLPQKPQSFSEPHWARQKHTGSACDMCSCPSCGVWVHVVGKRKTEKKRCRSLLMWWTLDFLLSWVITRLRPNLLAKVVFSIFLLAFFQILFGFWIRNLHRSARPFPSEAQLCHPYRPMGSWRIGRLYVS